MDLLYHFAGAECESLSSVGGLTCFRPENAPEGSKEKCVDCPEKEVCPYSAEKEVIGFNTIIERGHAHGSGDERIVEGLYHVLRGECENRTSLRESAECHLMGIAAEESRLAGGATVKVHKD